MSFFRKAGSDDSDSDSSSEEELLSDSGDDSGLENKIAKAPEAGTVKKSRFAKSSGESSSDDSDDDAGKDSDEEGLSDGEKKEAGPKVSRFARGAESDSSSEDEDERRKIVKSAKSKKAEELETGVKRVENAARIDDWVTANSGQSIHSMLLQTLCLYHVSYRVRQDHSPGSVFSRKCPRSSRHSSPLHQGHFRP